MEIDSHKVMDASPQTIFSLLMDPEVLLAAMPGLKKMVAQTPDVYDVEMEMGLPGFKGKYVGTLTFTEISPPESYHLALSGEGPNGTVSMDLTVRLRDSDNRGQTDLHYSGIGHFGPTGSGMGQKVLSGASSVILGQFFNEIAKRARKAGKD